jgi:Cytosol aminopeptidase family, N-terminal domain
MKCSDWLHILLAAATLLSMQQPVSLTQTTPVAPVPKVIVLVQSPAVTKTELQIFCLFRSSPMNPLHGSLIEINEKLHGLLDQLRTPGLFNGDIGETILLTPPAGTVAAKKLLIIGLGDSSSFTPARMYLVGKIALREANRLGIAHPYFAPTILDGGVTAFSTADVAEQVVRGLRDALATESLLRKGSSAGPLTVDDFTFLAGTKHAADTQGGINRVLGVSTPSAQ